VDVSSATADLVAPMGAWTAAANATAAASADLTTDIRLAANAIVSMQVSGWMRAYQLRPAPPARTVGSPEGVRQIRGGVAGRMVRGDACDRTQRGV
jgi:hypothetical protein